MTKKRIEIRNLLCALIASVLAISLLYGYYRFRLAIDEGKQFAKVGFIYDGDASTPYSANFIRATNKLKAEYGDKVEIIEKNNVPYESAESVIDDLASQGCDIIFTNSYGYGETAKKMAEKYTDIQFCEATCDNANSDPKLSNYHTFMGEIYQGRYISGIAAGAKPNEMINDGIITEEQAVVGFVAAYPVAAVISGYTAFLLGVRSQCPSAVMKVKYINTWTSYSLEKEAAEQLIEQGCVIISHHSNTIASAIACQNADKPYTVYHVGYNQDMMDIAPTVALTSCRIDWSEYIIGAVDAVLSKDDIESHIKGTVNGYDASGGFKEGWVEMLELNPAIAPDGASKIIEDAISDMSNGKTHVFKGDYVGVDPTDQSDTYDLNKEYIENEKQSAPTFHYVLKDVITVIP